MEDLTPHGYTPKLRQAIFTWFNTHLKGDPTPVTDDVTDFVEPEENLLVFGGKLPEDDAMNRIDKLLGAARPMYPRSLTRLPGVPDQQAVLEPVAGTDVSLHGTRVVLRTEGVPIRWERPIGHVDHVRV